MFGRKKKAVKNGVVLDDFKAEKKSSEKKFFKLPKVRANFKMLRNLSSILDGSILTSEIMVKNVMFFIFLFFLALVYIGNNFVSQSKVKKIDSISKELKDLHDQHISTKSDLMYFTKRSEVAKRLRSRNIKEATKPPYKIYVLKEEDK
jgi:hypothetical protein